MTRGKARIAVIGTGWYATQVHLPAIAAYDGAELVALVDRDERHLRASAEHYGVRRVYADHRELLAAGDIDAVIVAVPHVFHYQIARDALLAGLHVLVEKPMVLRAREARDLVEVASRRRLHLLVGYPYRFTRHAEQARQMVAADEIGNLLFVSCLYASSVIGFYEGDVEVSAEFPLAAPGRGTYSDPAIAGGGQGQTQVTHAIDMIFHVTGRRATEVFAFMEAFELSVDVVDAISFRLEGGAIGTLGSTGSLRGQPQQEEFRYYGTKGVLLQDTASGTLELRRNDGSSERFSDLDEDELYPAHAPARLLADLVVGKGDNVASGESAVPAVEFLEAAYRSMKERRPIATSQL